MLVITNSTAHCGVHNSSQVFLDKEIKVALHHIVACQSQLKPIFPINYSLTQQTYYSI